jgi:pantetheine-phosphate adenylyltransferase
MKKRVAVYPGSFDPVTSGHIDIIQRASEIFDSIIVAVIINPEKKPLFDIDERIKMLKEAAKGFGNVEIDSFDGLLIDFAEKMKASIIIRGLRAVSDFDYEFQMALTNRKMDPKIETVFLMTDYKHSFLSSSLVKQIARLGGDISELVPASVKTYLKKKFK